MYTHNLTLLAAAGGGGGAYSGAHNDNDNFGNGQDTEAGAANQCDKQPPNKGTNGNGATLAGFNGGSSGGGAGWLTNGHDSADCKGFSEAAMKTRGFSRQGGWLGGTGITHGSFPHGGFGGGGGACFGGGGGGYSGGAGGVECSSKSGGGGGGSYCRTSTKCTKTKGGNTQQEGKVTIQGPIDSC